MLGQLVSHYEILEKLGEGGAGVVYKARDLRLDRLAALKFLSPQFTALATAAQRFAREARAISALNHPNIATIYEVDERAGNQFLVLEYLPGGTLRARIRDLHASGIELPLAEICSYGVQIAAGLAHAHRNGIVHRDVKTGNVMFTQEGALKVTDFGLAQLASSEPLTQTGAVSGTAAYMSPEQAQSEAVDYRTDVFSLGVVLYEMACAELPFKGTSEAAILHEVVFSRMPEVKQSRPDLPEGFEEIVQRATAKRREERYQSMDELAKDLRALYRAPELATTATVTLSADATPRSRKIPRPPLWKRAPRQAWLWAALILAVLLAGGGLLWKWLGPGQLPVAKQIAVLPFTSVGSDPGDRALCDGLVETLTAKLTQMEQFQGSLQVLPATEVRKAAVTSAGEARGRFGVTLVLTGSLQHSGSRVRLTTILVDAKTLRQLRSDTLDASLTETTILQDGVVTRVARMLELELQPKVLAALSAPETKVSDAFQAYVQGLGLLSRHDVPENIDKAISLFEQATRQDPGYAVAYARLGEACWRKFRATRQPQWREAAQANCKRAVELNGQSAPARVTLGLVYRETGRYEQAIAELQEALKLDPASADAHRELANAYEGIGRNEEAEVTFRRALELRPDSWIAHRDLGVFYSRRGRYADAEQQLRAVVALTPDNAPAYVSLGGVLHLMGRYDDAIAAFQKSISIQPSAAAFSNLGTVYTFQGRFQEAVPMFEKAIEFGTGTSVLWGNLASSYRQVPRLASKAPAAYNRAIELARRELAVNPKDAAVRARLASCLATVGKEEEALAQIEEARKLAPKDVSILFKSALVYEASGKRDLALNALGAAIQSGYSIDEIRRATDLAELRKDPRYAQLLAGRISR